LGKFLRCRRGGIEGGGNKRGGNSKNYLLNARGDGLILKGIGTGGGTIKKGMRRAKKGGSI